MGKAKHSCPSRECSELVSCWIASPGKAFILSKRKKDVFCSWGTRILECMELSEEFRTTRTLPCLSSQRLFGIAVSQCCRALPVPSPGQGTWHVPLVMPWPCAREACAGQVLQKHLLALEEMLHPEQNHQVTAWRVISNRYLPIFNYHQQWVMQWGRGGFCPGSYRPFLTENCTVALFRLMGPWGKENSIAGFVPRATHWVTCSSFTDRGKGELSVLDEECYGTGLLFKIWW